MFEDFGLGVWGIWRHFWTDPPVQSYAPPLGDVPPIPPYEPRGRSKWNPDGTARQQPTAIHTSTRRSQPVRQLILPPDNYRG